MAITKIQAESMNLADTYAFTGTVSGAGGGKVGQIVQVVKTDIFSTTSTSFVDVTGLTATITPSATSSKVLVTVNICTAAKDNSQSCILLRGSTQIALGDAASNRTRAFGGSAYEANIGDATQMPYNTNFLDSPNTTSATTYKIQGAAIGGATLYYGRGGADTDNAQHARTPQIITLTEILV
ncbi:uncharacterized protein [uncultured Mediterranean phage uvMED]|nr:uncharacterized protein [uncultured Mediterranean phage uvMED]